MTRRAGIPGREPRRSLRLKGFDYSSPTAYFVTICADQRRLLFDDERLRSIIEHTWIGLPARFPSVRLDAFVVMPNHIHLIIRLTPVVAPLAGALNASGGSRAGPTVRAPKLSDVIGAFKSIVAVEWTRQLKKEARIAEGRVWQPNFYERIVRGDAELARIREYILANPAMWARDRDNPHRQAATEYDSLWQWLEESLADLR